jgi:hypothetical protein
MSHERKQRGKAEKRRATRGRRGRVYGRGVRASWPRGIMVPFIKTVEAVRRSKRDDNHPRIGARTVETRQERNGRCIRVVQVEISRPAARLSLHLLGSFENRLSSVDLVFVVVGVIGFFFDDSGEVIAIEDAGDGDKGTRACEVWDEAKGSVPKLRDGSV